MIIAERLSKSFSGVNVLDNVSLELNAGEIHALLGENGAGKSTLLKILAGVHRPDSGRILLAGRQVTLASPHAAARQGIALIHQEPQLFPDLSIAENVFLGHDLPRTSLRILDWRAMRRRTGELLDSLGMRLDPRSKVRGLSVADQQMVELAAALSQNARVLLMDEPTASLTPSEAQRLFTIMRRLMGNGVAIAFISHRLAEILEVSQRITVLRDGRLAATHLTPQTTTDQLIREMVGRTLGGAASFRPPRLGQDAPLLEVQDLSCGLRLRNISLKLHAGEIVGLAGLVGAGRTDLARALFGLNRARAGEIRIAGRVARIRSPREAVAQGIAALPEDRQQHGLFLPMSVAANISAARLPAVAPFGLISRKREQTTAAQWAARLRVRLRTLAQPVRQLSGGNQQKTVLAKWLNTDPVILILDEPTRGVDVGAKAEVHDLIVELARHGKAIILISSDLPEVLALSDRILVMREGRIVGTFAREEATQENIMRAATGESISGAVRDTPSPAPAASWTRRFVASHIPRFREGGIATVVLLGFVLCALLEPRFLSRPTLSSILLYIPLILVIAMGQMMVIISRNIDLSVGSILGLAAIIVGHQYIQNPQLPLWLAAGLAAGVGAGLGLFNGILVALLRIPAIIATLGTLTAWRGLVFIYSGGRQVDNNFLPENLLNLSKPSMIGVPAIVLFAALVALAAAAFLRFTGTGREIYAIGASPPAAHLRGIPVRRVLLLIFTLTGAFSGIAGLMYASRFGVVNPATAGAQMELVVISAVVIGGVNVFGGSGTVLGVVLGCLLLGIINVALPTWGIAGTRQLAIYGGAILLAAALDSLIHRRITQAEVTA